MEKNILKVCSFYVSDWHLTAMLLPFIEEAKNQGEHINTILEKNISYNMREILSRMNMTDRKREEIIKIGWENKDLIKYGEIKKYMEKVVKSNNKIIVIVEGKKERVDYIGKSIERWMKRAEDKLKKKEIKIIDCYEVSEFNKDLDEILNSHDKILNTSGIHDIEEMYEGFVRKEA